MHRNFAQHTLRHIRPMWNLALKWITPRTTDPAEAFRERNLRFITLMALPLLTIVVIITNIQQSSLEGWLDGMVWWFSILAVAGAVAWAVQVKRILLAGRLTVLVSLTSLFDPSAAYWSPGTVLLTILFSFLFLVILRHSKEIWVALAVNFAVYLLIAIPETAAAPLDNADVFSSKVPAIITTLIGCTIFVGLGYYVRRDQAERDRHLLLAEKQRADFLQELITNISHDIRTPLTRIKTDIYLLQKTQATEPAELEQRLASLESDTDYLEGLLEDVLEMSRLESGAEFEPTRSDLALLLKFVVDKYAAVVKAKNQQLDLVLDDAPGYVMIDQSMMSRAVENILDNATKFTPAGGSITVRLQRRTETDHMVIEITDNGSGIAPEDMPFIFEQFFRADKARNPEGGKAGLGLAISKKIIEMHNGSVEAESLPGERSTFRILLPALDD